MFREAFVRENFDFDFIYDWILKKQALKSRLAAGAAMGKTEFNREETVKLMQKTQYKGDNKLPPKPNIVPQ